jgi:hypothetical protein
VKLTIDAMGLSFTGERSEEVRTVSKRTRTNSSTGPDR